ncbi:Nucleolar protein 12 [Tilletia horrida]|uniref:Nucleolar protein 12 n=1 Tax=Tilletia horrida TaxID=155126 RepID=A0AAN6GS97_9BASI|nr:Nucleolar protein 12 [Tilletia horrida]KAK0568982.1 Nucleolar protein 12 [Tilletia horrida]
MSKSIEKSSKKRERDSFTASVAPDAAEIVDKNVKDKKTKKEKKAKATTAAAAEETDAAAETSTEAVDPKQKKKKDKSSKADKRKSSESDVADEDDSRLAKKARKEAKAEKKQKHSKKEKKSSSDTAIGAASSAAVGSSNFLFSADSSSKFDSELDAMFAAAPPPAPAAAPSKQGSSRTVPTSTKPSSKSGKPAEEQVQDMDTDDEDQDDADDDDKEENLAVDDTQEVEADEAEEADDEDLSSLGSDEFDALYADDDDATVSEDGDVDDTEEEDAEQDDDDEEGVEEGQKDESEAAHFSESEDEDTAEVGDETEDKPLVHETLQSSAGALEKLAARRKREGDDEPAEIKDRRTVFIGNIPVEAVRSKTMEKALRRHIESFSPVPGLIKLDAVRFRSVPFSVPTDSIDRDGAGSLKAQKHRERTQLYKEASRQLDNEEGRAQGKVFLNANQKRKVAAINQDLNTHAAAVNAYVTINHPDSRIIKATWGQDAQKGPSVNASVLAALLAVSVNGSIFEARHLRADVVTPLEPREVIDAGLDKLKSPSNGSLLVVGHQHTSAGTDNKRTVFVGNLDFEAEEEELRTFFEKLVRDERGKPSAAQQIEFVPVTDSKSALLFGAKVVEREGEWVQDVRLIRDRATQMGKGFGYVRFVDTSCVEEVLAAYKAEEAYIEALKTGRATKAAPGKRKARDEDEEDDEDDELLSGAAKDTFRRRFKFRRRLLRVTPCKNTSGGASNGGQRANRQLDNRTQGRPERGPGSSDRRATAAARGGAPRGSTGSATSGDRPRQNVAIAAPEFAALSKEDRAAIKRADPTRNARRMEKKQQRKQQEGGDDSGPKARVKLAQGKSMKRAGGGGGGVKKARRS